jgi:hypothetical protein
MALPQFDWDQECGLSAVFDQYVCHDSMVDGVTDIPGFEPLESTTLVTYPRL